jgi:hypothetical protein
VGKITDEELKQINQLKQEAMEVVYNLGELEYQKVSLDLLIEEVKLKIRAHKAKESQLLLDLKNKYGNVNINIETGEF